MNVTKPKVQCAGHIQQVKLWREKQLIFQVAILSFHLLYNTHWFWITDLEMEQNQSLKKKNP